MSKLPKRLKKEEVVAIGPIAVWTKSIITAGEVLTRVQRRKSVGLCGTATVKGKKIYWCRYGFLNDDMIYTR
tara:strand:+ start:908 stop:1123 length:216 start_codon:yes stop_codon:yes gene_type:complete